MYIMHVLFFVVINVRLKNGSKTEHLSFSLTKSTFHCWKYIDCQLNSSPIDECGGRCLESLWEPRTSVEGNHDNPVSGHHLAPSH